MDEQAKQITNLKNEIKMLQAKLTASNTAFTNVVERNRDGIIIFDEVGKIIYANPATLALFGRDLGSLLGEQIGIFINPNQLTEIVIVNQKTKQAINVEVNIGDTTWNHQTAKIASLRDVTEHKKLQNFLEHLSYFDYLTNLANRVSFETALKKALNRASHNNTKVVLYYMDLNGFKQVNDTYGHHVGDLLLKGVGTILKNSIREADTVARLGGDEFAIIVEIFKSCIEKTQLKKYAKTIINQIHEKTKHPIIIANREFFIHFSIGIAIYPDISKNAHELITHADKAMYDAKKSKKNYRFYSDLS